MQPLLYERRSPVLSEANNGLLWYTPRNQEERFRALHRIPVHMDSHVYTKTEGLLEYEHHCIDNPPQLIPRCCPMPELQVSDLRVCIDA